MGDRTRALLKRLGGEQGQTVAEYTLLLVFATTVCLAGVTLLGLGIASASTALGGIVGGF